MSKSTTTTTPPTETDRKRAKIIARWMKTTIDRLPLSVLGFTPEFPDEDELARKLQHIRINQETRTTMSDNEQRVEQEGQTQMMEDDVVYTPYPGDPQSDSPPDPSMREESGRSVADPDREETNDMAQDDDQLTARDRYARAAQEQAAEEARANAERQQQEAEERAAQDAEFAAAFADAQAYDKFALDRANAHKDAATLDRERMAREQDVARARQDGNHRMAEAKQEEQTQRKATRREQREAQRQASDDQSNA